MGVIDFTDMQKRNKAYAGANGKKLSVLYDGEQYAEIPFYGEEKPRYELRYPRTRAIF